MPPGAQVGASGRTSGLPSCTFAFALVDCMRMSAAIPAILSRQLFRPDGFEPWPGLDPFLFCVHHYDRYPKSSSSSLGPDPQLLRGRNIGNDFSGKDGFSMYHGEQGVPGFPRHPHRGFETLTVVRQGYVDHSDSLGATARYGQGDAQWLTTGSGICHAEMFPLVSTTEDNTMELFQIWINLSSDKKTTPPWFEMYWDKVQPTGDFGPPGGAQTHVRVVGGSLAGLKSPPPPPNSWAANESNCVVVATIKMDPAASWVLPKTSPGINRVLYFFKGREVSIASSKETKHGAFTLRSDVDVELVAGNEQVEFLLLQGRPIGEPVVQRGPFVVNTEKQLQQAFVDYRQTEFGAWRFASDEPTHPREATRFAILPNGKEIRPPPSPTDKEC